MIIFRKDDNMQEVWDNFFKSKRLDFMLSNENLELKFLETCEVIKSGINIFFENKNQGVAIEGFELKCKNIELTEETRELLLAFTDMALEKDINNYLNMLKEQYSYEPNWLNEREKNNEEIIHSLLPLAYDKTNKYNSRYKISIIETLFYTKKGLAKAINDFKPEREIEFKEFAIHVAEKMVGCGINNRHYKKWRKKLEKEKQNYER
jgi:hypothetical protein